MKKLEKILICSSCESQLKIKDNFLRCLKCKRKYSLTNGVVTCNNPSDYYWGEITREEMNLLISDAKKLGYKKAIEHHIYLKHPHLINMVAGKNRIDWMNLVNNKNMTILDVGSGFGQTSFLLAKEKTNTVISLEQVEERTVFQEIRRKEEQVKNLFIINGNFLSTTFTDESFDLITFIGVLEWIGAVGFSDDPYKIQLSALRKAYKQLKNGGHLCIGIENRIGFNNFLGAKDHSGMRFTSLMPRSIANSYMKIKKPSYRSNIKSNNYRTYTYSASGYEKLLRKAGFIEIDIMIVHPHYARPRCLLEMNNKCIKEFFSKIYQPNSLKNAIYAEIFRTLAVLKIADLFAPHFIIITKK